MYLTYSSFLASVYRQKNSIAHTFCATTIAKFGCIRRSAFIPLCQSTNQSINQSNQIKTVVHVLDKFQFSCFSFPPKEFHCTYILCNYNCKIWLHTTVCVHSSVPINQIKSIIATDILLFKTNTIHLSSATVLHYTPLGFCNTSSTYITDLF